MVELEHSRELLKNFGLAAAELLDARLGDRNSAELFFRLICGRYENGSIILTSNKFFSDWGELMSDTVIATAMLDRLLHHAHVVNIRGESYRLKDRLKFAVQIAPPANISAAGQPGVT
jgi:hypothetical protein